MYTYATKIATLVFPTFKKKAFKLKEDIRVYGSEDMMEELLVITAQSQTWHCHKCVT